MSLQPLQRVLSNLQGQYRQKPHHLAHIQACWNEIVGEVVAAQTRPCNFHRGTLKVATSSAGWAQNLVFERQRILDKLNKALSFQVEDIRFSTAQWYDLPVPPSLPEEEQQRSLWQEHPSRVQSFSEALETPRQDPELAAKNVDPMVAFRSWTKTMRSRSKDMPLCPVCHCPTPPGELSRWQQCAVCAAKHW